MDKKTIFAVVAKTGRPFINTIDYQHLIITMEQKKTYQCYGTCSKMINVSV